MKVIVAATVLVAAQLPVAVPASGQGLQLQQPSSPFLGGVPTGDPSPAVLALSLADAIRRGLAHNLGMALAEQGVRTARGQRRDALSDLLPQLSGSVGESRQVTNLAAFGFTGFPGVPSVVGPFSVFDARVALSQALVDLNALHEMKAAGATVRAREHLLANARDVVVLIVADLYLESVAAGSRIAAVEAQLETADALLQLATDLKDAGVVAQIDVLRAQVAQLNQRQRLIAAENQLEKDKLRLARVIGLPVGQRYALTDEIPYAPVQEMTLEDALGRAYDSREDYRAAEARVEAAEASLRAVTGNALPSLRLDADYGDIGSTVADSHSTYRVAVNLHVPIFEGGRLQARRLEADGLLEERRAELADFRARIDYEVRSAFLDVKAAADQLQVADTAVQLAEEELVHAQDRFAAGVSSNVEVVQAQESVARATDSRISSLLAHNVAKAALALALGLAEEQATTLLGGTR
jgi:outer membrane protein TolC